jgi:iron complex outermembrane receptor protein
MSAGISSSNRLRFAVAGTLALASLAAAPARGAPAPAPAAEAQSVLEDVIVSATRRETNLQSTPIAISAIDSQQISQSVALDIGELAPYVPNFSASRITGFNAASFAMRGVGQNNIIVYFESPVAVLVDDFVMPSVQTQLLDPFDLESVEVLRGPQGTLFGKNTTGGAVVVRTKRPVLGEFGGEGRATFGEFGRMDIKGMINVPIGETMSFRLSGGVDESDGYMRNGATYGPITGFAPSKFNGRRGAGDGSRLGGEDVQNARAKFLFQPSDDLSVLFQYEWLRDRSDSIPAVNETPRGDNTFLWTLIGIPAPVGDPIDIGSNTNRRLGNFVNTLDGYEIDVNGAYLNIDWTVGPGKLTSVTGWREQKSRLPNTYVGAAPVAADGDILSLFDTNRADDRETYQQEFRYATDFDGIANYVVGAFFQDDEVAFCANQVLGFLDLTGGPLPFGPWNNNPYSLCNSQDATSYAAFGEGTFKINEKLTLTAGLRYTKEEKTWRGRQQAFLQTLGGGFDPNLNFNTLDPLDPADFKRFPTGVVTVDDDWGNATWRLMAGYQFTDSAFGYASYSRGFKSGGFNDQTGGFAAFGSDLNAFREAARPTDPEFADSYEVGVKTQVFDDRLRVNATVFYVDYSDLQKQIVVPIVVNGQPNQVTTFFNAAKADVLGAEFEVTALVTDRLTLRGALGLQDGEYKEYVTPIPAGYDLSSAPLDRTPKTTASLDATYRIETGVVAWVFNANANHVSENLFTQSITDPAQNSFLNQRTLVNASVTLSDIDSNYYLRLIGRNLTDERYRTATQTVGGLWTFTTYGEPRWYGVEIGAKFGGGSR